MRMKTIKYQDFFYTIHSKIAIVWYEFSFLCTVYCYTRIDQVNSVIRMKNSVSYLIFLQKDKNQMHELLCDTITIIRYSFQILWVKKWSTVKLPWCPTNLSTQMKVPENHSKFHVQFSWMVSQYMDTIKNMKLQNSPTNISQTCAVTVKLMTAPEVHPDD